MYRAFLDSKRLSTTILLSEHVNPKKHRISPLHWVSLSWPSRYFGILDYKRRFQDLFVFLIKHVLDLSNIQEQQLSTGIGTRPAPSEYPPLETNDSKMPSKEAENYAEKKEHERHPLDKPCAPPVPTRGKQDPDIAEAVVALLRVAMECPQIDEGEAPSHMLGAPQSLADLMANAPMRARVPLAVRYAALAAGSSGSGGFATRARSTPTGLFRP